MRIPLALALAALAAPLAACSTPGPNQMPVASLPGLSTCADDDCPPTQPVVRPGELVPVYETRDEPIWEERRTPVWGLKTVPVYQVRRVPVTVKLPDPCSSCEKEVELWDREERVQVGVQRVRACVGYKTERVQVGTCPKRVRVGWQPAPEAGCP